ncbi:MAG: SBBP repeat-containing protein [Methanolinea sp.]|nr:SBBP repeat-containing protein [Methanolinea sp.]
MRTERLAWIIFIVIVIACGVSALPVPSVDGDPAAVPGGGGAPGSLQALPLLFVENAGQAGDGTRFVALTDGGSLSFAPAGVSVKLAALGEGGHTVTGLGYRFPGANPCPEISGLEPAQTTVNFLLGNDPSSWYTGVPAYRAIVYGDLYPGIDLEYSGTPDGLKSTFLVSPGARAESIAIEYSGISGLSLAEDGSLEIHTPAGTITESPPVSYQVIDGTTVPVRASFALLGRNRVGFSIGPHDPRHTLVIDPVMKYGVSLRGLGLAHGRSVAASRDGSAYVTGETFAGLYSPQGKILGPLGGGTDIVVAKVNPGGTSPVYVVYIGGSGNETPLAIAIDPSGEAVLTGTTESVDFPLAGAVQGYLAGNTDAFALRLSPDGSDLLFSTYLGGTGADSGNAIALDPTGNIVIAGDTSSFRMPDVDHPTHTEYRGNQDAFVLKLTGDGSEILYAEYIGGRQKDSGKGVAVDRDGNAYVTGETFSADFPVANAYQSTLGGGQWSDAFVTKVAPGGERFVYSTYLGGPSMDAAYSIAVDSQNRAHVTGSTFLSVFPVKDAFQSSSGGAIDAFYSVLSPSGRELAYSTYLGGFCNDWGTSVVVDQTDTVFIAGTTGSINFPVVDPFQPYLGNWDHKYTDAFLVKFCPGERRPDYATYVGGSGMDTGTAVATDGRGNAYLTGFSDSSDFPFSDPYPPAFEPKGTGGFLFVLKDDSCLPCVPPTADFSANVTSGYAPLTIAFESTVTGTEPFSYSWSFGDNTTSAEKDPTHTYTEPGNYTVSLTVANDCGEDTETKTAYVLVRPPCTPPTADFSANVTSG